MKWVAIDGLDDDTMVRFAAERRQVRLDNGHISTLVGWPRNGSRLEKRGRRARLERYDGVGYVISVSQVVEVDVE